MLPSQAGKKIAVSTSKLSFGATGLPDLKFLQIVLFHDLFCNFFFHRRLFPALLVSMQGLDPEMDYTISLKVATADNQRYRYINMKWCATGESEVIQNEDKQIFRHPSSPNSGHFWMKRPISFKSIKITHYAKSLHGNVSKNIISAKIDTASFFSPDPAAYHAQIHDDDRG